MSTAENNHRIDYIEFPVLDLARTKEFYGRLLGWRFEDYGPDYASFHDGRLAGGFYTSEKVQPGGALVVIYVSDIEAAKRKAQELGAAITRDIFDFPGGRRFQFLDPSGHELSFWTNP